MRYIPGQNDQLLEAIKGTITGDSSEGRYARKVLGEDFGQSILQESLEGTYAAYLAKADEMFFKKAVEKIKKIAGGYAEEVYVGGRGFKFLSYKGQDRSDLDLEFTASLTHKGSDVIVHYNAKSAQMGTKSGKQSFKLGTLKPDHIVSIWREYFGR
jgi:hypothetical protein